MRALTFIEQAPLPTESEICEFEEKYEVRLPVGYREFLLEQGGGIVPDNIVVTYKSTDPLDEGLGAMPLREIYSIHSDSDFCRLSSVVESYRTPVELVGGDYIKPNDFIPIANNWFGDDYCIGVEKPVIGEIYLHIHDASDVGGVVEDSRFPNFFFIASNFTDFLSSIMTGEEYEER